MLCVFCSYKDESLVDSFACDSFMTHTNASNRVINHIINGNSDTTHDVFKTKTCNMH